MKTPFLRRFVPLLLALSLTLMSEAGCAAKVSSETSSAPQSDTSLSETSAASASPSYTFVWMSDTQYYSEDYPEIYTSMTSWIAANRSVLGFAAVIHTGDLTDDGRDEDQWKNAVTAMKLIPDALPCVTLAGNRDVLSDSSGDDYTGYLRYFGPSSSFYASSALMWSPDGQASAVTFEAGTVRYLIAALSWDASDAAVSWAGGVLAQYPDRVEIVVTHDYLNSDGTRSDSGDRLFEALVRPNPGVRLVLCGHKYSAAKSEVSLDDDGDGVTDRTVYQLIADYQNAKRGGNGFLRLLTVDEASRTLKVSTYSPYRDKYDCFSADEDEFTLQIADWWGK